LPAAISTIDAPPILAATTTARRTVFVLPRFSLRRATISVRVTSAGKPVQIDGLGVLRA
jgi:hypothetical protein